jgi:hypothetical protein
MSVQNIINIYLASTDDEKADGIRWYPLVSCCTT